MVDGKPVDFVTGYEPSLGVLEVVSIYSNGACQVMSHDGIIKSAKDIHIVKPKVLDADGAEIREGDRVWSTHLDEPHEWIVIDPHEDRDDSQTVLVSIGDRTGHARPEDLTHRAPVLAADGEPLEVGQTVYYTDTGREYQIHSINDDGKGAFVYNNSLGQDASGLHLCSVGNLTHQRPVLDAEGVPIHEGDTVLCIGGGEPAEVAYTIEADASHPDEVVLKGYEDDWPVNADMLTHTKSEPPDTRASVITGLDEETIRRIDKLVMDGRWLDD